MECVCVFVWIFLYVIERLCAFVCTFYKVMERVCDDVSGDTDKFYCGNIIEEHEEDIEEW